MFKFYLSEIFRSKINKIKKKRNLEYKKIFLKVQEIINCDEKSIDFYKNLKYELSKRKK